MKMVICSLVLLVLTCGFVYAQQDSVVYPKLTGPYMGQKPPTWGPEPFLPGVISSNRMPKHSPMVFSSDGTEAYWVVNPLVLYYMKQVNNQWIKPEIAPFAKDFKCLGVSFSHDEKKLYFTVMVADDIHDKKSKKSTWLYYVERENDAWSEPMKADSIINNGNIGTQISFGRDGSLYFSTTREGGKGEGDIYYSKQENGRYTEPINLGDSINTEVSEGAVCLSPDNAYILFTRHSKSKECPDGAAIDYFISYRKKDGSFTKGYEISYLLGEKTSGYWIGTSPDGKYIFFTSRYPGRVDNIYWTGAPGIVEYYKPDECVITSSLDEAIKKFKEIQKSDPKHEGIREGRLNTAGYNLLNKNKIMEALELFRLNVELYPQSTNAFNSLGEAYEKAGENKLAIKNYEISLKLKPDNKDSIEALKRLKGK